MTTVNQAHSSERFAFPTRRSIPYIALVPDTEADTCRKFVVPRLQATGWEDEPHSIAEQRRIVAELDALLPVILDKAFQGDL